LCLEDFTRAGEEKCLIFTIYSDNYNGDLYSIIRWAEKDAQVLTPNDFTLNNSDIELEVFHSPKIIKNFDGREDIQVCISGNEIGAWKGSLEYRTEPSSNIGVGVGTWLRVKVQEPTPETQTTTQNPPASSSSSSSSGSSGGGSSSTTATASNNTINNSEENFTQLSTSLGELEEETPEEEITEEKADNQNAPITGAIIGGGKKGFAFVAFTAIIIIALLVLNKRRNL
jgi:hypothetical protein